jgi:hypothetical protein
MLRHVSLVRTDVSEELSASFNRVTKIGELGTTLALTINRRTVRRNIKRVGRLLVAANVVPSSPILVTLRKEALSSFETSVLTRATRRNIPVNTILNLFPPTDEGRKTYTLCVLQEELTPITAVRQTPFLLQYSVRPSGRANANHCSAADPLSLAIILLSIFIQTCYGLVV